MNIKNLEENQFSGRKRIETISCRCKFGIMNATWTITLSVTEKLVLFKKFQYKK